MKFKLGAGKDIDLLTSGEVDELLKKYALLADQLQRDRAAHAVRGPGDWQETDANGYAVLRPYRVPQGAVFDLHHVIVTAEGATVSVPYKATPVAVEVHRDEAGGDLIDFAPDPDQVGQLPTIIKRIRYPFKNGEQVVVVVVDAAAATRVYANVAGELRRI